MLIRQFELEAYKQFDKKNILGTLHACIGQEAVAVGCCEALKQGDYVTSTHRGHGHLLALGGSVKRLMAELFGRRDGYCFGKGGTQHIASLENGFLGSNGITGGGIPYATGLALAMKMRRNDNLTVCFLGDGASNQGTFHESINIASIWKLPVIYVCENNQYAMSSKFDRMMRVKSIADRASAYGIQGKVFDGNDVLATSRMMRETITSARAGNGPVLIEAKTYRISGHSRRDTCSYRSREEEQLWAAQCPIKRLQDLLVADGSIDREDIDALEDGVRQEIKEAVNFAESSDYLSKEDVLNGVYSR